MAGLLDAPAPAGLAGRRAPQRRSGAGRRLLVGALWAGLLLSVALWWRDTPAASLSNRAELLVAAGQITGLIAGYLLLAQILLMSRLGLLERLAGTELLTRWHRDVGTLLTAAVLAHVATIVLGYSLMDNLGLVAELRVLMSEYEDMTSAVVAAAVLVAVAAMATRWIRNALRYEVWKALHLLSYLALLLGFGHQFANGAQLFQPGVARDFWAGLYLAVLACLAWGRVVAPLVLNLRHGLRVASVVPEGPEIVSIYLAGRGLDRVGHAGQFFRWRFLAPGYLWQAHPFSLSASPNGHWLRLTVKVVGAHTAALRDLPVGTRIWAQGPYGGFTALRRTRSRALLIAGGSGIAPIRALLEELPRGAAVIYRVSHARDVVLRAELDRLAESRDAEVYYVIGSRDDPAPRAMMTGAGLRQIVPDVARRDVYLCGPPGMVEGAVRALRAAGVPRRQIHQTTFEL